MKKSDDRIKKIKDYFIEFFHENGTRCCVGVDTISRDTAIPAKELYDYDNSNGLLVDLSNQGYLCGTGLGKDPAFSAGSQLLEDEFRWWWM